MELRARTILGLLCALLAVCGPPAAAGAEPPAVLPAEGDALADTEAGAEGNELPGQTGDLDSYWARRLENASRRILVARDRAEKADAEYSRARHDRDQRGESLEEIKERRVAAERELRDSQAALPHLVELARRAGVSPGVLRDYWDEE